jgi:hypothetical protein
MPRALITLPPPPPPPTLGGKRNILSTFVFCLFLQITMEECEVAQDHFRVFSPFIVHEEDKSCMSFEPSILNDTDSWGPPSSSLQFSDILYQPFNKVFYK